MKRATVVGLVLAAMLAVAVTAPVASAKEPEVTTYLALGDSLAFGYSQEKFEVNFPNESPSYFEEGYVNYFANDLRKANKGLVVVNDGCPGETSGGLIGHNVGLGGGEGEAYDSCRYNTVKGLPLHNSLAVSGHVYSQLEDALSILKEGHPAHPMKALTIDIGGETNPTRQLCKEEIQEEYEQNGFSQYESSYDDPEEICQIDHEFTTLGFCERKVKEEYENSGRSQYIRKEPFHPFDPIEGEQYGYVPTPRESVVLCDEQEIGHVENNNQNGQNMKAAIKRILSNESGGGHYQELEEHGAGPIVVIGFYNPYSFAPGGSDALHQVANKEFEEVVGEFAPWVKFVNPMPVFNPGAQGGKAEEKTIGCSETLVARKQCHKAQVGKYVEMGNPVDIKVNKEATEGEKQEYSGAGDSRPTKKGYEELAKLAYAAY